ncbi:hypothetical protein ACFX1W_010778 [Malus domestica]
MKRNENSEKNGPRNPIASFAVAGSKSASTKLCIRFETFCGVLGGPMRKMFETASISSDGFNDNRAVGEAAPTWTKQKEHCAIRSPCLGCLSLLVLKLS